MKPDLTFAVTAAKPELIEIIMLIHKAIKGKIRSCVSDVWLPIVRPLYKVHIGVSKKHTVPMKIPTAVLDVAQLKRIRVLFHTWSRPVTWFQPSSLVTGSYSTLATSSTLARK